MGVELQAGGWVGGMQYSHADDMRSSKNTVLSVRDACVQRVKENKRRELERSVKGHFPARLSNRS